MLHWTAQPVRSGQFQAVAVDRRHGRCGLLLSRLFPSPAAALAYVRSPASGCPRYPILRQQRQQRQQQRQPQAASRAAVARNAQPRQQPQPTSDPAATPDSPSVAAVAPRSIPAELAAAKYELRLARVRLGNLPHYGGRPGGAVARAQAVQRQPFAARVRELARALARLRQRMGIPEPRPFFRPRPATAADHRIARQYRASGTRRMFRHR